MKSSTVSREYDLDWIRVIATLVVFLYHISMFFNPYLWHVKNNVINESYIWGFSLLIGTWIMPIFFAISGITTLHALQRRSNREFMKERFIRLGIPLVFGVFVLTPPQVYIERITHQQFEGSFLEFFPHYFDGVYLEINGTGNFAFVGLHLWYLLVLFIFSLLLLPIFSKLKVSKQFNFKHYMLLPFILWLVAAFVEIVNLGGWGLPYYLVIYVMGYRYFSQDHFKSFIQKYRYFISFVTIISSVLYLYGVMNGLVEKDGLVSFLFTYLKVLNSWNWLLLIFYLGKRYLTKPKRGLNYLSQASMPFYVLHQPIIVGFGFYLYQKSFHIPSKLLLITLGSFVVIVLIYHFVVQRVSLLRVFFGLKGNTNKITQNKSLKSIPK